MEPRGIHAERCGDGARNCGLMEMLMSMLFRVVLSAVCALFIKSMALAEPRSYVLPEENTAFRPALGMEAAQNNCLSCHSADYVSTQPPRLDQKFWQTVVSKMVKAYNAPISQSDAELIVEYLSHSY